MTNGIMEQNQGKAQFPGILPADGGTLTHLEGAKLGEDEAVNYVVFSWMWQTISDSHKGIKETS